LPPLFADVDQDALCRSWLGDRTALVALTKGPDGAVLFTRGAGRITIPLVETVVADTVGAGDSFYGRPSVDAHPDGMGVVRSNRAA
jgi:fructokinase